MTVERRGRMMPAGNDLDRLSDAVRTVAFRLERRMKMGAPYRTGCLKASIYTTTNRQHGYARARQMAQSRNRRARLFPAVPAVVSPYEAWVAVAAEYGQRVAARRDFVGPHTESADRELQALVGRITGAWRR